MEFKIGEMAKMNNVTIHTLRHYDKIGILKPSHIDEGSGYRFYTLYDCDTLNQIKAYKAMGFSLDRIKIILSGEMKDVKEALSSLKSNLIEEKRRIEILENYVEEQLESIIKLENNDVIREPQVIKVSDRYGYKIEVDDQSTVKEILEAISAFEKAKEGHGEVYFKPTRISHLEGDKVILDYYLAMSRLKNDHSCDLCIEGGQYLIIDHVGGRSDLEETYKSLYDFAKDNNLTLEGTVIELLLIPEAIAKDSVNRITQIQLKLKN